MSGEGAVSLPVSRIRLSEDVRERFRSHLRGIRLITCPSGSSGFGSASKRAAGPVLQVEAQDFLEINDAFRRAPSQS